LYNDSIFVKKTKMRTVFFSMLCCIFLFSCQSSDKKQEVNQDISKQAEMSEKYQMKVFQISNDEFNIICLNKFTGDVFVRNNNGSWYNAQDATQGLKEYKYPVYSFEIIKGADAKFQIVLLNSKNGNVYVRSYSSAWYEASGIRALEE